MIDQYNQVWYGQLLSNTKEIRAKRRAKEIALATFERDTIFVLAEGSRQVANNETAHRVVRGRIFYNKSLKEYTISIYTGPVEKRICEAYLDGLSYEEVTILKNNLKVDIEFDGRIEDVIK